MAQNNKNYLSLATLTASLAVTCIFTFGEGIKTAEAQDTPSNHNTPRQMSALMEAMLADAHPPQELASVSDAPCVDGMADIYPCNNIDLLAFMPLAEVGGTDRNAGANDVWGWTDPISGKEYAILGRVFGTSFVDISDPVNPVYLGELPAGAGTNSAIPPILHDEAGSTWRDIKVYADHAYIGSEASNYGMQVFDLTQLRDVVSPPITFAATALYLEIGSSHNIVINEDSGFAYAVGVGGTGSCGGGLHMIDISTPDNPVAAGCFSADGYTHDAQCVIYQGPDTNYQGSEICFNANEDTVTIVDVTNKSAPVQISRNTYSGSAYAHQGWLTPDHAYFLLGDELDELNSNHNTRTRIWDISNLSSPFIATTYDNPTTEAIDHNLYTKGDFAYQANYRAGLSILNISNPLAPTEVANFDVYPSSNSASFNGAWSNFPYFESGVVVVSGIEQGLFILRPNIVAEPQALTLSVSGSCPGAGVASVLGANPGARVSLFQSRSTGADNLTRGACSGTETGLRAPRPVGSGVADENGSVDLDVNLRPVVCSGVMQVVDMSNCGTSNVVQIQAQ